MGSSYSFSFLGANMTWEYKKLTFLSDSSVFATWGGTAVNVSILRGKGDPKMDFLPLQVEYLERYYASGMISDSPYQKREGHPSTDAILKARVIDRAIRPRFNKALRDTIQVYVNVLSYDPNYDPLILGFNTTVAALMASSIPFNGPLAGLRVGMQEDGSLYINPKVLLPWDASGNKIDIPMDYVLAVEPQGLVMIDAGFNEVNNELVVKATELAKASAQRIYEAQQEFAKQFGIDKQDGVVIQVPESFFNTIYKDYYDKAKQALGKTEKEEREKAITNLEETIRCRFAEEYQENNEDTCQELEVIPDQDLYTLSTVNMVIEKLFKKAVAEVVLNSDHRIDGRAFDEVRKLSAEVGVLPRTHGSAIFRRGDTMVLTVATLASLATQLHIEEMTGVEERTYIHEYYAAPYAYGEPGRLRFYPGRREIGHGALAEKAVLPLVPNKETFPYMIRVVSEVVSSSGSTSMAATTGSSLALMDAGVPIKRPATGISIGVIATEEWSKYKLLTDIVDIEDFYGGMDFKVAGTEKGITAIQMDQKYGYIPFDLVPDILAAAEKARLQILEVMKQAISKPRSTISKYAPQIQTISIPTDKIGMVIGSGGKVIKELMEKTGTTISIEDNGQVSIAGKELSGIQQAEKMINDIVSDAGHYNSHDSQYYGHNAHSSYKVGDIVDIVVEEFKPFGAIVRLPDGNTALLHISEISNQFIKDIAQVLTIGEHLKAKVIQVDDKGRVKVSIKQLAEEEPAIKDE